MRPMLIRSPTYLAWLPLVQAALGVRDPPSAAPRRCSPRTAPKIRKGSRTDRAGRPGFWTLHAVSAVWTLQLRRRPLHALYGVGIAWPEETYGLRRANGMGLEIILSNCIKELSS